MNCLIFGCLGSLGNFIYNNLKKEMNVFGTTTNKNKTDKNIIYVTAQDLKELENINDIDIIIWAHGVNLNDNIDNFNTEIYLNVINSNVTFILTTLNFLLNKNKINNNAKIVIVSSIWEEFTKENKLSYSISKSALSGLVKNLSIELSKKNILINNILPGVIENEMSRTFLKSEQLEYIKNYLHFNRLLQLDDIYNVIYFFVTKNTAITGQSIKVDLGFTNIKKI